MTDSPFSLARLTKEQAEQLKAEWPIDDDGFPHRQAARVVLFDPQGETLLILGHDVDDLNHRWWFTVGGGIDPDESPRDGAARELREETGLRIDPNRLIGPVLYRQSTFHFALETRKQDENFFLLFVSAQEREFIDTNEEFSLTSLELDVLDEHRWWDLDELARIEGGGAAVYPRKFVEMARRWREGWDGTLLRTVED